MVRLYANEPPQGRCLLLADGLHRLTALAPAEAIALAERLFSFAYTEENPAVVEVAAPSLPELQTACAEFEIMVEMVE